MKKNSKVLYIILITSSFIKNSVSHSRDSNTSFDAPDSFMENDLSFLSELPIEKLLKVKKSINELKHAKFKAENGENELFEAKESRMSNDDNLNFNDHTLRRDALTSNNEIKIIRKTGYGAMENPWDSGKPSKIQTFFQISVTALAFLAFAGYLLCMIVQAIKSKGTMYLYPNTVSYTNGATNTMNSLVNTGSVPLRKRRPLGRKKRSMQLIGDNRNFTTSFENNEAFMSDPSEMYYVMIQCAEDFTKFYHINK